MFVCKFFLYDLCQYKTDTAIMRNYLLIMALQSQHALPSIFRTDTSMSTDGRYTCITTHLLPIERSDWSKQEDKFFCGCTCGEINSPLFVINGDAVARIESRCVIKAKHASLQC